MSDLLNRIDLRYEFVQSKLADAIIDEETGCWEYQGQIKTNGYGYFTIYVSWMRIQKRKFAAHRVAYAFFNGVDPKDKFVCHSCDNPKCINPDHLWLGTHQHNMNDMVEKGRQALQNGFNNGACKITKENLVEIVRMLKKGYSNKAIADKFSVTHSSISSIRRGKSWSEEGRALGWEPKPLFNRKAA